MQKKQIEQINKLISELSTEHWKLSTDTGGHLIANIDGAVFKTAQEIESCTLSDVDKEKTWLLNNAQFRDLSAVVGLPR